MQNVGGLALWFGVHIKKQGTQPRNQTLRELTKIIILEITVGKLDNIAGSKSKVLKRFPGQQAGVPPVLH